MTEILSQVKYVVFFCIAFFGIPVGYMFAKKYTWAEKVIFFFLIFFTARMEDINFVSRETYRITTRGFEIGMVDILVLIIFLLYLNKKKNEIQKNKYPVSLIFFFIYITFSFLSIFNAPIILFSFFELFKMARMMFFFIVIYNYLDDLKKLDLIVKFISFIIIYIFIIVLKQKYLEGVFQASGPFPHQNSLVMYVIIFTSIILAYLMNRKDIYFPYWVVIFGMGAISIVSTLSRAGMAVFALSVSIIMLTSITSKINIRKIMMFSLILIGGVAVLYKASDSIIERFKQAPKESAETRIVLAKAAVRMANDKVFGIGLNNFGICINPPFPYGNHIEVNEGEDEDVSFALVETVYLMIAAETGWINLFVFLLWLIVMYIKNLINLWRYKDSQFRYFCIGILGGLSAIYIESALEWVLKQTNNFYQLMFIFAVISAMDNIYLKGRIKAV